MKFISREIWYYSMNSRVFLTPKAHPYHLLLSPNVFCEPKPELTESGVHLYADTYHQD